MSAHRRDAHARSLTTAELVGAFTSSLPSPGARRNSFQRALGAQPRLAPAEPGDVAFRQWLADIGETPDEDDIPALYADMAELCGWPMAEATAVDVTATAAEQNPPEPPEKYPPLPGRDAAQKFLDYICLSGRCGTYTADDLDTLYTEHAASINRHKTPVNTLRKELAKLPGVMRCIKDDDKASRKASRRSRTTTWTILDLSADVPEAVDLTPMREAA